MPIYDQKATPILEKLQVASEEENMAIGLLYTYLQEGSGDRVADLAEHMEKTHEIKMQIYKQLLSLKN